MLFFLDLTCFFGYTVGKIEKHQTKHPMLVFFFFFSSLGAVWSLQKEAHGRDQSGAIFRSRCPPAMFFSPSFQFKAVSTMVSGVFFQKTVETNANPFHDPSQLFCSYFCPFSGRLCGWAECLSSRRSLIAGDHHRHGPRLCGQQQCKETQTSFEITFSWTVWFCFFVFFVLSSLGKPLMHVKKKVPLFGHLGGSKRQDPWQIVGIPMANFKGQSLWASRAVWLATARGQGALLVGLLEVKQKEEAVRSSMWWSDGPNLVNHLPFFLGFSMVLQPFFLSNQLSEDFWFGLQDHAASRYIFTCLSKVTRCIFPDEDDAVLEPLGLKPTGLKSLPVFFVAEKMHPFLGRPGCNQMQNMIPFFLHTRKRTLFLAVKVRLIIHMN